MPLLERGAQLGSLLQYAAEARQGNGRMVLLSGEAGIGKSSLMEELQHQLPEATWVWGACDGLFTPRPLAPLFDMARDRGGDLEQIVRQGGRDRVFDEVLAWLQHREGLTVMVVEDVHWADDATLDLLRFLARRLRSLPVLLLVSYRDDALAPTGNLRLALGELAAHRHARRIDLPPLTEAGVRALAEGTSYDAGELHRLTGGNPFFVVELARSSDPEVPATIRDAVLARAATLAEPARTALDVASVAGRRVDTDLIRAATGTDLGIFDELVLSGLLRADGDALGFQHELSRRAIESAVPAHRRAAAHRAILEALPADSEDARVAYHAEGAGLGHVVTRHAPAAARQSAGLGAYREAVQQFERALRFPPSDPRELATLLDEYADALAYVDSWTLAAEARERAIDTWRDAGDAVREGYSHRRLCAVYWRLCRGAESVAEIRRAIELLEPLGDDPELAYAYSVEAWNLWPTDPDRADAMMVRAREMAARIGDPVVHSDVLNNTAKAELVARRDWTGPMQEALRLALDTGAEAQVGRAYANAYTFFLTDFRYAEGERWFRDGLAYCDERDITTYSTCLRGHRALALLDQGHWDEALALARRVLATEASPVNLLTSQVTTALVAARRGDADPLAVLDVAVAAADGVDETEWITLTRLARAEAHWLAGDEAAAAADLQVVRARITPADHPEEARLAVWERRLRRRTDLVSSPAEPWATWLSGEPQEAAARWDALGCPWYAAQALADSADEIDLRQAIARLEALGATAVVDRTRARMKELGLRGVPIGVRASTREHPLGLTRREDEVLDLLAEGLSNDEIAGRLVVSVRTVDHHVSAVLTKLGVSSRGAAVAKAQALAGTPVG